MMKLARPVLFLLSFAAVRLAAQVAGPSPLTASPATAQLVPGGWVVAEARANAALQAGFPATAMAGYRELLRDPALPPEAKQRMTLSLVTALLDAGEMPEAEKVLAGYSGPRTAAYHLRAGLIAIGSGRREGAKAALAAGKPEDLPAVDRGWWFFLQGSVADAESNITQANELYERAKQAAVSELQRVRFELGIRQALLLRGRYTEADLPALRDNMDRFQGQRIGYTAVRTYATALAELNRAAEAQAVLQRQLALLPPTEREAADQFGLMLGLIAGTESVAGRQAFRQLLREAQKTETQQLALLLLMRGAKSPADRTQLRNTLTEFIDAVATHPIIENLILARAQLALADQDNARAELDARDLLVRYPGSALKVPALNVRLAVAWDEKRYRTVADVAAQLRGLPIEGRDRAELGVLLAEAFFRAEDYKNAGDAYAAALQERPVVVPAGTLIFQRVLSDIRADRLEAAARQLDEAAATPGFDAVSRWQAEWNLVKEMQVRDQTAAAQARVERLLAGGAEGVPEELRIRLMWLRTKLSSDNRQHDTVMRQSDELLALLQKGGRLDETLRVNVASTVMLLKAQALLTLKRDAEGVALLDRLRTEFKGTEAAQYSYLAQASHLSLQNELAAAQGILIRFVDDYPKSDYAPLALYKVALILERQGLDRQLGEANEKLEKLVTAYPQSDLVFYARLKQGDLLRTLNYFAQARQVYEDLVNNFGQHPDILRAQLALAKSLFAQGANSVVNYESAAAIFERLRDLPSAPVDLRVEAGYHWGYALAKRAAAAKTPAEREAQLAKAATVYWSVVDAFLLDATQAARLEAKGRYWLSRALLELGQIHENAGRLDEAQRAYRLIVEKQLSGAAQAQAKLARFGAGGAKP